MMGVSNIGYEPPVELSKPNNRTSLLFEKVRNRIRYHADGRTFVNSELVEHMTAEELWENLLLRTFAVNVKQPTEKDAEEFVRRMTRQYKEKKRMSRPPIESITEEDLKALQEASDEDAKDEPSKSDREGTTRKRSGAIRWRDDRHVRSMEEPEPPRQFTVVQKKVSLDPSMKAYGAIKVKFTGAINVEIDDEVDEVEDADFNSEEARFVTLIDVNDSLIKEVLLEEHRRLDEEVPFIRYVTVY